MIGVTYVILVVMVSHIHGHRLVLSRPGSCINKIASTSFAFVSGEIADVVVSGKVDLRVHCSMDLCKIPSSGRVTQSGDVWGIDATQTGDTTGSRAINMHKMIRKDCDTIHGSYTGNPTISSTVDCKLFWKKMSGSDRSNIDSLIVAGAGSCAGKMSSMKLRMTQVNCFHTGGTWPGNPGAHDVIDCDMDVCVSPVIGCEPSDSWTHIQTCENPSSATIKCSFELTTGLEKGTGHESSTESSVEASVSSEISAEIAGLFSASLSISVTTGFSWASAVSSHNTWSKSTTRTIEVDLKPHQSVSINQVIGACGVYKVKTPHYRVMDVNTHESTEAVA